MSEQLEDDRDVVMDAIWIVQGEKCADCGATAVLAEHMFLNDDEQNICASCDDAMGAL